MWVSLQDKTNLTSIRSGPLMGFPATQLNRADFDLDFRRTRMIE